MLVDEKYICRATGLKVRAVRSCRSTFDELGDNDVIIAGAQRLGAGRGERKFFSPEGGLYIVMREKGLNIDAHTLTPAVGLAVHDAIKTVLGLDTELKWINDVIYNDKKAAGILVRSPLRGEYLIGVGINYSTDDRIFEKVGLPEAISLRAPISSANVFCVTLIKRIHHATLAPFDFERYGALCRTVGKTVSFMRGGMKIQGFAERVENDGSLIVRIGAATVAVDAGEVSIVREAAAANN